MDSILAFVAKSFDKRDVEKTVVVEKFLSSFAPQGFFWEAGDHAEPELVSLKVRNLIETRSVFVGIFTKRHPIYDQESGIRGMWNRAAKPPRRWTAPPWLLQESGYALALKKDLILFREKGVEVSDLQGDLEYIDFDPAQPSMALQRASEMINALFAKKRGISVNHAVQVSEPEQKHSPEVTTESAEPNLTALQAEVHDDRETTWKKWSEAIESKDWETGDEMLEQMVTQKPESELRWRSYYHFERFKGGVPSSLDSLKSLHEKNLTSWIAVVFLARSLERFGQYDQAVEALERSAEATQDSNDEASLICEAGRILRDAKKFDKAKSVLLNLLYKGKEYHTVNTLEVLFGVLRANGDLYQAAAVGELVLTKNPGKQELRFSMGLDYSNLQQAKLFLQHYKVYCENDPSPGGVNNLGSAYDECKLPIHAMGHYLRGHELGEAYSTRNLANQYLNAGFANQASELMQKVIESKPETASFFGKTLSSIDEKRQAETKEEEELLANTSTYQQFMAAFGDGLIAPDIAELDSVWKFRFGEVRLQLGQDIISGATTEKSRGKTLLHLALGSLDKEIVTRYVFQGSITGRTCDFEIEEEGLEPKLGQEKKKRKGYIVFDLAMKAGLVMETTDDRWRAPYPIKRVDASASD